MAINYNYLRSPTLGSDWSEQYYAFVNAFESIGTQVESLNATYSQSSLTATLNLFPTRASMYEYVNSVAMTGGDAGDIGDPGDVVVVNSQGDGLAGMSIIGAVTMFAGATAPNGWHLCDGSAISRTDYAALFAVIGTTYGTGNGTTTFNLPDTRGIFVKGAGTSATHTTANGTALAGTLGEYENDMMQGHAHYAVAHWKSSDPNTFLLTYSTSGNLHIYGYSSPSQGYSEETTTPGVTSPCAEIGSKSVGTPRTGNRTQPANISLNYIIYTGVYT